MLRLDAVTEHKVPKILAEINGIIDPSLCTSRAN